MISDHNNIENTTEVKYSFDNIYKKASENNVSAIQEIQGLDIRRGILTPAGLLASEGKNDAVILLIQHGASVHEAAMGAAIGKQYALAELLHQRYGAHINYIAKGAVIAGDYECLANIRKSVDVSIDMIAEGAAIKGDFTYVQELRDKHTPDIEPNKTQFLASIARGAMIGGHQKHALELLQENDGILHEIINGAVIANNISAIEELTIQLNLDESHKARCAAYHGNKEYCVKLVDDDQWSTDTNYRDHVKKGIFMGSAANSNMQMMHEFDYLNLTDIPHSQVIFLTECINSGTLNFFGKEIKNKLTYYQQVLVQLTFELDKTIIEHAIKSLNFEFPLFVFNNMSLFKERRQDAIVNRIEGAMIESRHFLNAQTALHQLSFIDDHAFLRVMMNRNMLPPYISKVIPDAIKINLTMKRYNLEFDQAQALLNHTKLRKLFLYLPFNLGHQFPFEITLSILMVFSPLTLKRTHDLYDKMSVALNKIFLKSDIEKYNSGYWLQHRNRASSFLDASKVVDNRKNLLTLIKYQKDLFDGVEKPEADVNKSKHEQPLKGTVKDEYYNILEKNTLRMK